ncbi:MAG: ChaN family lipoprotein [Pseudomonadota bacterium]
MQRLILAVIAAALSACAAAPGPPVILASSSNPLDGTVWDVAAGQMIPAEDLPQRLAAADIAVLGEIHDNQIHHERQAWLVDALDPVGVAFEMVPEASEEGIAVFLEQGGERDEIGPAIGWERLGWPDWDLYRPIFAAAEDALITGGGVARADLRRVSGSGAAAVFGRDADLAGLTESLPQAEQATREADMVAAHCDRLPLEAARAMVEAQRLRDARFAEAALRARPAGEGTAVLITGNGHARSDRGVPVYLARLEPEVSVLSLGQLELRPGQERFDEYAAETPYDFVWFAPRPDRPDPCDSFQ